VQGVVSQLHMQQQVICHGQYSAGKQSGVLSGAADGRCLDKSMRTSVLGSQSVTSTHVHACALHRVMSCHPAQGKHSRGWVSTGRPHRSMGYSMGSQAFCTCLSAETCIKTMCRRYLPDADAGGGSMQVNVTF
jgi:hypothetical protein